MLTFLGNTGHKILFILGEIDVAEVRIGAIVSAQQQIKAQDGQGSQVADVFVRPEVQTWFGLPLWAH